MKNKKNITLVLGLILSLCSFCTVYAQDEKPLKENETSSMESAELKVDKDTPIDVLVLIKKKDYNAALPLINAYIESKPKKYIGYQLRGEIYYALRQYDLAVEDFQKAVDIKTEDDKFATNAKVISAVVLGADKQQQYQNPELGSLYARLMYAQKALNNNMYEVSYKKALEYNSHIYLPSPKKEEINKINCPQKYGKEFNPQGIDVTIYGIIEDIEKGNFSEAAYKLPKLTTEYPNYYLGQYLTGVVMYTLEQDENAINAFNNSIKLNPKDFESYASLGLLYYDKAAKTFNEDYAKKSIENFEKAIALNSNCSTYYFYIGLNHMELGDWASAVNNFKKALVINPKDYNSMYYKSIAQYLQKDYTAVVDETTKMLYKHVSNYNSVLYLRALANYRLKNEEAAIADIEKIHQNMNDIYSYEVRQATAKDKDKVLKCYLYYLQSKISRDNGFGAKTDLQQAYQNPLIALLDTKGKDFAQVNFKLTTSDIEEQYEYLITTFDNLGVGFEYLNPDYKIVAKKQNVQDFPQPVAEKSEETIQPVVQEENVEKTQTTEVVLEKSQEETMVSNLIAEMKEYDSPVVEKAEAATQNKIEEVATEKTTQSESTPVMVFDPNTLIFQPKATEKETQQESSNIELENQAVKTEETLVSEKITTETSPKDEKFSQEIKPEQTKNSNEDEITQNVDNQNTEEEKVEVVENNEKEEAQSEDLKEVLQEESFPKEDVEISTPAKETEPQIVSDEELKDDTTPVEPSKEIEQKQEQEQNIEQDDLSNEEQLEESNPKTVKVNEKYADVNLAEFEVKNKKPLNINEGDEVIFLETKPFLKKEEKIVNEKLSKMSFLQHSSNKPAKFEKIETPQNTEPEKPVDVNITKDSDNLPEVSKTEESKKEQVEEPQKEELSLIEPEEIKFPEQLDQSNKDNVSTKIANKESTQEQVSVEKPSIREFSKEEFDKDLKVSDNIDNSKSQDDDADNSDIQKNIEAQLPQVPNAEGDNSKNTIIPELKNDKKSKKNKVKKSKTKSKDNLIIAVGGNVDDYAKIEDEKVKETKDKTHFKKKDKHSKTGDSIKPEQKPEISLSEKSEIVKEEAKVSEVKQEKKIKEQKLKPSKKATKEVSEEVSKLNDMKNSKVEVKSEDKPIVEPSKEEKQKAEVKTVDKKVENSDTKTLKKEISNNKPEVQKPKRFPFWKRWFSRKKKIEQQTQTQIQTEKKVLPNAE